MGCFVFMRSQSFLFKVNQLSCTQHEAFMKVHTIRKMIIGGQMSHLCWMWDIFSVRMKDNSNVRHLFTFNIWIFLHSIFTLNSVRMKDNSKNDHRWSGVSFILNVRHLSYARYSKSVNFHAHYAKTFTNVQTRGLNKAHRWWDISFLLNAKYCVYEWRTMCKQVTNYVYMNHEMRKISCVHEWRTMCK